jgi:acyl-CoA thioester hydrolase
LQHYFAAVSDGMFAIMVRLGLGPEEIRRRQMSFAVVRAETDFDHELHPGDVVALESTVLKLGEKSATFHHRLKNVATGNIAMSTEAESKRLTDGLGGSALCQSCDRTRSCLRLIAR